MSVAMLTLLLALPLASCGGGGGFSADGGVSGTGISSVVGNVTGVTGGNGNVAGIRVIVQGTDVETVTGEDGSFTLNGAFDGEVIVVFEIDDGRQARTTIDVPTGGTVDLEDVTVDPDQGEARPTRQIVTFAGTVDGIDCDARLLTIVVERDQRRAAFRVRLADAFVHDPAGVPVPCDRIHAHDRAAVQGEVLADGTIGRADVEIRRPPPTATPMPTRTPRPTPTRVEPTATSDRPGLTAAPRPTRTPGDSDQPRPQPTVSPTSRDHPIATPTPRALATAPPLIDRRPRR